MPQTSILSDELVRDIMAVGQVDVIVGVPTLNNAATVTEVVQAVSAAFDRYFPRDRTLLLNSDGGSTDGTPALVRNVVPGETSAVTVSHRLRTEHRISAPYHGLPGKGSALRQILTVADLAQASAVAILDADVTTVTPEWIAALIRPVRQQQFDYVAPVYMRQPSEGLLILQLIRPLMRAAYGWQVREPLAAEFGCSPRFLAHCLEHQIWDSELARYGIDLWITGEALSGGFTCCQAPLGPRLSPASPDRPGFPEVFSQVVGSAFGCLEAHAEYWMARRGSEPLPIVGSEFTGPADIPATDGARLVQSFCTDLGNLHGVLEPILSPATLEALNQAARDGPDQFAYVDDLWVSTVYEFLIAYRRGVISRDHVTRALAPLYLGRTGAFLIRHAHDTPAEFAAAEESLNLEFERRKPELIDRWNGAAKR